MFKNLITKGSFFVFVPVAVLLISYLSFTPALGQPTVPPAPPGYDGFQFQPPFTNVNPFDKDTLKKIDEGFHLFTTETFGGNGRTCGTCHIPKAQYNVLPGDIATMTAADKTLVLGGANATLEDAELVQKLALFNINEGFGPGSEGNIASPLGPFRSSMPLLSNGLGLTSINFHICNTGNFTACNPVSANTSALHANPPYPGCTENTPFGSPTCVETISALNAKAKGILPNTNTAVHDGLRDVMLGWGGNGALIEMFGSVSPPDPEDSQDCQDVIETFAANKTNLEMALAAFSLAAVKTHFPITQGRVPGVDFRCPTPEELDAMAKHQKWLGRRYELDITELDFENALAAEGRDLFLDRDAGCSGCHINAGANDNQGRLKLGPFDVIPPLTTDQVALATDDYCADEVTCTTNAQCRIPGSTCNVSISRCVDGSNNVLLVDPLVNALDEIMPRSGMGANKTSRSGIQFLEPIVNDQVAANFPFDQGDGQLRGGGQGGFNVQPAFQAAVKTNFFHNNAIAGKLENAIAHYFTDNFDKSQGGGAIKTGFRCNKSGPIALAALGGQTAIDKIGYFLRSLFSIYALSDCERFMDEAVDRINEGLPIDLPLTHCQFELNDVQTALGGSNINTNTNKDVLAKSSGINKQLSGIITLYNKLSQKGNPKNDDKSLNGIKTDLGTISKKLVNLRQSIATTPEIED